MATVGQNFNGYLWKMTDKYGNEGYLVTETPDMKGNVLATNVDKSVYGGKEHYSYSRFSYNAVTLEDVSAATTTKIARVDYNKRKFGPVTVKSYTLDSLGAHEYETTLQSIEEYDTQSVSLDELINSTKSAMNLRYGGKIDIIDSDAFVDGKTYTSELELESEIAELNNGYVGLGRDGDTIDVVYQGTLTGYDIASEKFNSSAAGTVISLIGFSGQG